MQNRTSANIIGPDLNEYRGEVNYSLLATRTNYCYLRGSGNGSGRFRADRKFIEYVKGLANVGIKTGAYHYAVPSYDLSTADQQCDQFIDILQQAYGQGKYGDLFPTIDIETPVDKSISTNALLDWVDRFRKRFERKTRRKMMLYTGSFFIELYNNFYHTTKGFILSDMPLWIAMYPEIPGNPPYPQDQGGWTRWRMWQYTENGTIAGVSPPVDLNYGPVNLDLLTQPDNVSNLNATVNGRNIRVTWSKNNDVDLAGYNLFLSNKYLTTVGRDTTSYTIELGPSSGNPERYTVGIEAFDVDGDFSPERTRRSVTLGRSGVREPEYQEKNDVFDDRHYEEGLIEDEDFIDYSELDCTKNDNNKRYEDPVNNLAKRFIYGSDDDVRSADKELNKFEEPDDVYGDFVEENDEFDDVSYMEKLREENAYKAYYGDNFDYRNPACLKCGKSNDITDNSSGKKQDNGWAEIKKVPICIKGKHDDDSDDNEKDDDEKWKKSGKCSCKYKEKPSKCSKKVDDDDSDSDDSDEDDVVMECKKHEKDSCKCKDKACKCGKKKMDDDDSDSDSDEDDVTMDCKDMGEFLYKERYEGDRRRNENRDKHEKKNKCKCKSNKSDIDDSDEKKMPIHDIYLKNCDYGYEKHSKHKSHGDIYYGKKKEKKHHHH